MIPRATLACAFDVDSASALPVHVHIRRTAQTVQGRAACSKPPSTASMAAFPPSSDEACFKRGFRPTCEIKTGTFDPRTIFCRLGISRS